MSFDIKLQWFRFNLEKLRINWQNGSDVIRVHKDNILLTTLASINLVNMHKEVKIEIHGEKVNDAGGLLREWMYLIMKEIVVPDSGMFVRAQTDEITYKINSSADVDEHVLNCFHLLGIVIGKAIFERIPINAFFDRTLIKQLCNKEVCLDDIYYYDKEYYTSWNYLMQNDIDTNLLMEYFVVYDKNQYVDLKENGSQVLIANSNKKEYVDLCKHYFCTQSIFMFIKSIKMGLYKVVPPALLEVFEINEIETILYGLPFISIEDWKKNTVYKGADMSTDVIQWYWEIMLKMDQCQL